MSKLPAFNLALITGATSGIGKQLAYLLASKNIPLILHGRDSDKLLSIAENLREFVPVTIITADLKTDAGQELVAAAIKDKTPDLIINNAGFGLYGHVLDYPTEEQLALLHVNAEAVLRLSIEGARQLKAAGKPGVIMNISSIAGFVISPRFAIYSASKAMVTHFSESFDYEMRPFGIRILAACPGVVKTNFRSIAAGKTYLHPPSDFFHINVSTEEAAHEIWQQIQRRQPVYTFSWFYRILIRLTRSIIPKKVVATMMDRAIRRLQKQ